MVSQGLMRSRLGDRLQAAREIYRAIAAEETVTCTSLQRHIRCIVFDAINRARIRHNVFLSERNLQLLLDGAREEAVAHESLKDLQVQIPPKQWFELAGLRGASIAFICNFSALLLLLFMLPGLVRDAVVAALVVCGVLGSAVAWVGRRRATRRIA